MRCVALVLAVLAVLFTGQVRASEYQLYSTILPPWSIDAERGIFVETVKEIEKRLGANTEIAFVPWSRAQYVTKRTDNSLIFPLTRISEREKDYKWIANVMPMEMAFASFEDRPITMEVARTLETIGVKQDTPPHHFLVSQKFTNLVTVAGDEGALLRMMKVGRIKAWFSEEALIQYYRKFNPIGSGLKVGTAHYSGHLYIAGSKKFPGHVAKQYRKTLEEMRKDGALSRIFQKYQR